MLYIYIVILVKGIGDAFIHLEERKSVQKIKQKFEMFLLNFEETKQKAKIICEEMKKENGCENALNLIEAFLND